MGTDRVKTGAATQGRTRVGAKGKEKKGSITTTNDSDIEILEIVQVGEKKHTNIGKHMGEEETKVKGKGKEKEMGRSKFIVPMLPTAHALTVKHSHWNLDGSGPSNLK